MGMRNSFINNEGKLRFKLSNPKHLSLSREEISRAAYFGREY